jgi:D-inositol-3-phosphate glycosyltransferase
VRLRGETEVVSTADRLVANTDEEAHQLVGLYGADPAKVWTVNPGVDLSVFRPGPAAAARRRLGLPADGVVVVFAGRVQPLKAPDIVLHAAAQLVHRDPELASRLSLVFVGGPSGTGRADPDGLTELARRLGIGGLVRLEPPCPQAELADWYRAADLVLVPSHSESFGLVALEAQACGTPVVAASVGGLRTAVRDGYSGVMVDVHDPVVWAQVLAGLLGSPRRLESLSRGARKHASGFGWPTTADRLTDVYAGAMNSVRYDAPLSEREVKRLLPVGLTAAHD